MQKIEAGQGNTGTDTPTRTPVPISVEQGREVPWIGGFGRRSNGRSGIRERVLYKGHLYIDQNHIVLHNPIRKPKTRRGRMPTSAERITQLELELAEARAIYERENGIRFLIIMREISPEEKQRIMDSLTDRKERILFGLEAPERAGRPAKSGGDLKCPICGKEGLTNRGLELHKVRTHKGKVSEALDVSETEDQPGMFGSEGPEILPALTTGGAFLRGLLFLSLVPLVRLEQAAVPPEPTCLWQHRSGGSEVKVGRRPPPEAARSVSEAALTERAVRYPGAG